MEIINILSEEHEQIEQEIEEFEEVIQELELEGIINFPNLIHSLKALKELWDKHEVKEDRVFSIFKQERIVIPVKTILFEHGELRKHLENIRHALETEDNQKLIIKQDGRAIITLIRDHILKEEEILLTISQEELTIEEIEELEIIAREFGG
jgi:DUF438 domain-containing protein